MRLYSYMMSDMKDIKEMRFLENLFALIKLYVDEVVPLKVEEALNKLKIDFEMRLNDKEVSSSALKDEVKRQIFEQFRA